MTLTALVLCAIISCVTVGGAPVTGPPCSPLEVFEPIDNSSAKRSPLARIRFLLLLVAANVNILRGMKKPALTKCPACISTSRWFAYVTAGAATALGTAVSAEGEIHYSGTFHLNFVGHRFASYRALPLTGGAKLAFLRSALSTGENNWVAINDVNSASLRGTAYFASKLFRGNNISAGPFYVGSSHRYHALLNRYGSGNFSDLGEGYIGFKFNVGDGPQYGWVRIKIVRTGSNNAFVVHDYAWGDPGDQIRAGQTSLSSKQTDATPASGSLGLLAVGSAGLRSWRQRRTNAAKRKA